MSSSENTAHKLALLQYNVNKSRKKVLIGLFQDPTIQELDILAIQEPWRNTASGKGYNTQSTFYLIEEEALDTRVSIYINRRIPIEEWSLVYRSKDLITISIQIGQRKVYIHNLYLPPSEHSNRAIPATLIKLLELLKLEGEHIALGDFNLHHPLWNPANNGHHEIADLLVEELQLEGLELTTPNGIITRNCYRDGQLQQSTLDLIFSSIRSIESCNIATDLEQSSDHLPIRTILLVPYIGKEEPREKRNYKHLNLEKFLLTLDQESTSLKALSLNQQEEIDLYISILIRAILKAIKASTPLKATSPFAKPFWTQKCSEAVRLTRRLRRIYTSFPSEVNWLEFTKQRNLKGKILSKAKRSYYQAFLAKVGPKDFWKPYKQAKRYNSAIQTAIPTLKGLDGQEITDLKDKANFLRDSAFTRPKAADLSDIRDYIYPEPLYTSPDLSEDEIQRAGLKTLPDSALGPDTIPNRIIHILIRYRIAIL